MVERADELLPLFIKIGFPAGITGLVLAGLLAAAMSSLSSGINAASSIITADFLDRFRKPPKGNDKGRSAKSARLVSVLVGTVVVVLCSFVGTVKGNLLEVGYKLANLLVAPLFGLFVMAIFVPWATTLGTVVGAICGLAAVFTINFWQELTGTEGISFLCALPLGLLVQIVVGMCVSLLPVRRIGSRS